MLKIYEAENLVDAQLALDELRAGGLDAHIKGQHLVGAAGELPLIGIVSVWITARQHEKRARDIIAEFEKGKRFEQPAQQCKSCDEIIEGNFGRCWKCNALLD